MSGTMSDKLVCLGGPMDGQAVESDRSEWECPILPDLGTDLYDPATPEIVVRLRAGRYVLAVLALECRFRGHHAARSVWLWDESGAGRALHGLLERYGMGGGEL